MTLGLRGPWQKDARGILWSLPLSYLRYYGRAVSSKRELSICSSRITFEQFLFLSLGSLTRGWPEGPEKVVQFLFALSHAWRKSETVMPAWLILFFESAQWYRSLGAIEREQSEQIFFFGRRRCKTLFGASAPQVPDGFGLCNVEGFIKALPSAESRVAWLREFLVSPDIVGKVPRDAVIRYQPDLEDGFDLAGQPMYTLRREECPSTTRVEGNSELQRSLAWDSQHCEFAVHSYHPDTRAPTVRVEFASVYPSAVAGGPMSHKRWIPANANPRPCHQRGHVQRKHWECPWQLASFDSPCTGSVLRGESLCENTKEDCGLYHSSSFSEDFHREISRSTLLAPALDPIRASTFDHIKSKGLAPPDPELCLKCGCADLMEDSGPDHPKKKRRILYTAGCYGKWYMPWLGSYHSKDQLLARSVYLAFGDKHTAALCLPTCCNVPGAVSDPATGSRKDQLPRTLDLNYVISQLEQDKFSAGSLSKHLSHPELFWKMSTGSILQSFEALLRVADV
jgi:hypothetical protein